VMKRGRGGKRPAIKCAGRRLKDAELSLSPKKKDV
jgi:hypothetical protein